MFDGWMDGWLVGWLVGWCEGGPEQQNRVMTVEAARQ